LSLVEFSNEEKDILAFLGLYSVPKLEACKLGTNGMIPFEKPVGVELNVENGIMINCIERKWHNSVVEVPENCPNCKNLTCESTE
jgi:hypothetical protein